MVLDVTNISKTIVEIIKTLINSAKYLWDFISQPILTINLDDTFIDKLLNKVSDNVINLGNYDISLLWFLTGGAIILLITLKIISLINPIG